MAALEFDGHGDMSFDAAAGRLGGTPLKSRKKPLLSCAAFRWASRRLLQRSKTVGRGGTSNLQLSAKVKI
jgi:hypothetical protein